MDMKNIAMLLYFLVISPNGFGVGIPVYDPTYGRMSLQKGKKTERVT